MQNRTKKLLGVITLVLLIGIFTIVGITFREKPIAGTKQITIEVIDKTKESTIYELSTNAKYLLGAMEEADGLEFSGSKDQYGLMVHTINGDTADFNVDGSYWSFYVNGVYCNYGISEQPVEDGDAFQIIYTIN